MHPDTQEQDFETTQNANEVSGRFLSDLFGALERQGFPASGLLGDLPIPVSESGAIVGPVEWNDFCEFLRRLGRAVDGPTGRSHAPDNCARISRLRERYPPRARATSLRHVRSRDPRSPRSARRRDARSNITQQ